MSAPVAVARRDTDSPDVEPLRWRLGHRPGLDGLRGVAVLVVLFGHAGLSLVESRFATRRSTVLVARHAALGRAAGR